MERFMTLHGLLGWFGGSQFGFGIANIGQADWLPAGIQLTFASLSTASAVWVHRQGQHRTN